MFLVWVDLNPFIVEGFTRTQSLVDVHLEQFSNEHFGVVGDVFPLNSWEVGVSHIYGVKDLFFCFSVEGGVATEEDIQDDPTAPDVAFLVVILF